jgi:hypothetical protein
LIFDPSSSGASVRAGLDRMVGDGANVIATTGSFGASSRSVV